MALDPTAKMIIGLLEQYYPNVGADVIDAAEARRMLDEAPQPPLPVPDLANVEDRFVPGPEGAPDVRVRVYRPRETGNLLPGIVFFHGGGWTLCSLDTHDLLCRNLALGTDAVVVSVDYRLAPEAPWPAAVDDAYAALQWTHANADTVGVDASRLAVAGDSAGGNIAAVVALMSRDHGGPPLCFQLLAYPVIERNFETASYRDNAEGYFLTRTHMEWYWQQYVGDDEVASAHPYAAPIRADDLSGLPPAHIVTAEHDPLRDEGEAYGARLRAAGVTVDVRRYGGMFHGFFNMGHVLEGARQATTEAFAALSKAFAGG